MIYLELKDDLWVRKKTIVMSILYQHRLRSLTGLFHLIWLIGYFKAVVKNTKENYSSKAEVIINQKELRQTAFWDQAYYVTSERNLRNYLIKLKRTAKINYKIFKTRICNLTNTHALLYTAEHEFFIMGNFEICHDGKVMIFKLMERITKSMFFYVSVWKRVYVLVKKKSFDFVTCLCYLRNIKTNWRKLRK